MRLFGTIEKVEELEDGTLKVSGIASSEAVDADGEVIKASAMAAAIPDYMKFGALREMHQPLAAGTALSCEVQEDGRTYLEALVVDPVAVKKVQTGTYKGFSIGGKVTKRTKNIIEGIRLTEISLVDRPANPEAVFSLAKMEDSMGTDKTTATNSATKAEDMGGGGSMLDAMASLCRECAAKCIECAKMCLDCIIDSPESAWACQACAEACAACARTCIMCADVCRPAQKAAMAEDLGKAAAALGEIEQALVKAGAKYSKGTKEALAKAHDMIRKADMVMKGLGYDTDGAGDDDADGDGKKKAEAAEAITKAAALEDELTKAHEERDGALQKANVLEKRVKELEAKIAEKPLKAVPIEKGADAAPLKKSEDPDEIPTDPVQAMKKIHASGGRLISVSNHNRLG